MAHEIHCATPTARDPGRAACATGLGLTAATVCAGTAIAIGVPTFHQGVTAEHLVETVLQWVLVALLTRLSWICAAAAAMCWHGSGAARELRPLSATNRRSPGPHRAARILLALGSVLIGATATPSAAAAPGGTERGGPARHTTAPPVDLPSPPFSAGPPPASPASAVPSPDFRPDEGPTRTASVTTHNVRPGDTLWGLTRAALPGDAPPTRIAAALGEWLTVNPQIDDPDRIVAGEMLHVPDLGEKGHDA